MTEPINAHVFRLRANKHELIPGSITLAVCAHGIRVCPDNNPASTFLWGSIGKLSFERKKFEIRTGHEKLTLYTSSDEKSKLLLGLCRDTHQFSMAVAPRLNEARKQEEEQRRCFRDCYLYSRMPCKAGRLDQRVSVISSTSSNTTSGIVSDRVHSEDELEIMITCPPAPSTESLALAHLLDSNPISRQSSSASAPNFDKTLSSLANTIENMSVLVINQENDSSDSESSCSERVTGKETTKQVDSESSVSQKTTGKCAGSQCSSSCSTVVVAEAKISRRASTSSSLELGYSHTAQNSTVSDATCIELDTRENTSGVYTLGNAHTVSSQTSGVYTMGSSQLTASSETAGGSSHLAASSLASFEDLDQFTSIDQVDSMEVFRDRSNSNVSNSGSFRGDGSDPTDNKQALLSAEELSDLIVGRGVYPSCKTVSNTLDSDSDYVTLPLSYQGFTPVPPKRVDSNIHNNTLLGIVDSTSSVDSESLTCFRPPPPPYPSNRDSKLESMTDYDEASCLSEELAVPHRDPPPYPTNLQSTPVPPPTYPSEEATARFITTRSQINILTAHTSVVGASSSPSYAAPASSTTGSIASSGGVPPIPPKQPIPRPSTFLAPENGIKNHPVAAIIAPNNYLDVAASKGSVLLPYAFLPPPPPPAPRQPPPPPPALATVYTSQLSRSQIEQYQQQMYSDVDFVVFPLKEPAISKQEYLEAKQGSLLAALAQGPPPYPNKGQMFYRSTPYLPVSIPGRYSSSQNLSDTYVQLPVYSATSISSTSSLEPPPPPPPHRPQTLSRFMRARSDDNILKSFDIPTPQPPKFRRLPPPPPPPSTDVLEKPLKPDSIKDMTPSQLSSLRSKTTAGGGVIDIRTLREKSKNLDLPLISALCNDRSLLKQTKAFVMPKHPSGETPLRVSGSSSKLKYPVSGLSNNQINKPRKPPSSHRHPGDKLPEIPRATPNNYVVTETRTKHKTMQSHS